MTPMLLQALLQWAGARDAVKVDVRALREASIDRLADAVDAHLDTAMLRRWLGMTTCVL